MYCALNVYVYVLVYVCILCFRCINFHFHSNLYISSDIGIQSIALTGQGSVTTLWNQTNSIITDITIDITEQILFWAAGNCIYEYRIMDQHLLDRVWCDFHHNTMPFSVSAPSFISYSNDKLYMILKSINELYSFDEHTTRDDVVLNTDDWSSIAFQSLRGDNVTALKFSHYTVQPG